ncbi:hypothetical protein ACQEVF_45685 [Nonomuraea polychroma]|uniref:hypothetical protein n=1 Tax=Nonomuraea polychroma TaxID=46176 RepID=UPI003D932238
MVVIAVHDDRALVFALASGVGAPALADGGRDGRKTDRPLGGIGIRLLEATLGRKDDPRAHIYIIDHVNPGTRFSRRMEIRNTSSEPQRVRIFAGAAEIQDDKLDAGDGSARQ